MHWGDVIRFLFLLALLATGPVRAAPDVACIPGVPWCDGGGLGLAWIPIVVGLQVAFLYLAQGGPGVFLARFIGNDGDLKGENWGLLQVGFPIALVLSFPALIGLTIVGKWIRPVGLLEIMAVQGIYWLLLARWSPPDDAVPDERAADGDAMAGLVEAGVAGPPPVSSIGLDRSGTGNDGRCPIEAGVAAVLPRAAVDGIPLFPGALRPQSAPSAGAAATLARPESVYASSAAPFRAQVEVLQGSAHAEKNIERLMKTYMWDDIGSGPPFKFARKLPPARLLQEADVARFGATLIEGMRAVCRHTLAIYRHGVDATTLPSILAIHAVDGFDEYSADIMQRLTYSVLLERQRLFIDQTDVEIFGEDFLDCLYRLALLEVRSMVAWLPPGDQAQAAVHAGLQ